MLINGKSLVIPYKTVTFAVGNPGYAEEQLKLLDNYIQRK